MSRYLLLLIGLSAIAGTHGAGVDAADHPNELLICVDDLKPTIGCFGDEWAVTPKIDPRETKNIAASNPQLVAAMRAKLDKQPVSKQQWVAPVSGTRERHRAVIEEPETSSP